MQAVICVIITKCRCAPVITNWLKNRVPGNEQIYQFLSSTESVILLDEVYYCR